MRFTHPIDQIFATKSKIKLLRAFSLYKKEMAIREASRQIGITPPNVSRILKELEKEGAVISKKVGRSILYSLNSNHYLVKDIILPVFTKEKKLTRILAKILETKLNFPIESIVLFGSVARGEEKPNSDIDLLFIISDKNQVQELEKRISIINNYIIGYFGNSISPLIIKISEFKKRFKRNDKLIKSISKEGVVLQGKLISEILCQR